MNTTLPRVACGVARPVTKPVPWVTAGIVAWIAIGAACLPSKAFGAESDDRAVPNIADASADWHDVPDDAFDCLIEPRTLAALGSPTQGIVARMLVERGEPVKRGQPVVALESSVERATLDQAVARADMRSETHAREAELALAELDLGRFESMYAKRLVPEQELDEASARRQVAAAALVQALENRRLSQLEERRMRRELERRTLRSPVDGVVVEHLVSVGELVRDNPVVRIAQLDPLRVEAVLPGRLFGTIATARGALVYPELGGAAPRAGTVDAVDPMLDARSGTFGVRLTLANADLSIVGGQRCRVAFDAVPAIPAIAAAVADMDGDADANADANVDAGTKSDAEAQRAVAADAATRRTSVAPIDATGPERP